MLKGNVMFRVVSADLLARIESKIFTLQRATVKHYPPPITYNIEWPEHRKLAVVDKKPLIMTKPRKMKKYMRLMRGPEPVHNFLIYKQYGLQALTGGRLRFEHFEFFRRGFLKTFNFDEVFALWRVDPPWQPVTKKPSGQKLGGGKGHIHHYVTPVKAGRIILEVGGYLHPEEAEKRLAPYATNLPFPARYVSQELLDKEAEEKKWKEENNLNPYTFKHVILNNLGGCNNWLSPYDYKWFGEYR